MWLIAWWGASTIMVVMLFVLIERYDWACHNNCRWNWAKLPVMIRRLITLALYPGILTFLAGAMIIQETRFRGGAR